MLIEQKLRSQHNNTEELMTRYGSLDRISTIGLDSYTQPPPPPDPPYNPPKPPRPVFKYPVGAVRCNPPAESPPLDQMPPVPPYHAGPNFQKFAAEGPDDQQQPSSVSVQEQIKKYNQTIANQNSSYKSALSPKSVKKNILGEKTKKTPAKKDESRRPFRILSPAPRRKNKAPAEPNRPIDRRPPVPSEAVKFIIEQKIENLLKETENKKKRREDFEAGIRDYPEHEKDKLRHVFAQKESAFLRLKRTKINKDMFNKIKTIGVGSFGEVSLVEKTDTGQLYAMKTLRKAEVWRRNQTAHVKAERDILSEADNEWVVKLHFSFQDKVNLYFVMEYVSGGDFMNLLIKSGRIPEWASRFYIAELVCAVESVHKLGFIHRDIKPDNILIDEREIYPFYLKVTMC
eukprot:sb/3465345/